MSRLSSQVALVTGATGGIGGAVTRALAAEGAQVILVGRDRERLAELAESVRGVASEVDTHVTDLADDAEVKKMVARVKSAFLGVDLLAHVAGVFTAGRVADTPLEELDKQLRVNLRAPFYLTQLLLPSLIERRGQVVFVNSTAGLRAHAEVSAYAASKYGLRAVADALRDEVNGHGVRVVSIYPGRVATPMQQEVVAYEGGEYRPERLLQPEDVAAAVLHAVTQPRTAEVTDLRLRPFARPGG